MLTSPSNPASLFDSFAHVQWSGRGTPPSHVCGRGILSGIEHFALSDEVKLFTAPEIANWNRAGKSPVSASNAFSLIVSSVDFQTFFEMLRQKFGSVLHLHKGSEAEVLLERILATFHRGDSRDPFHEAEMLYRLLFELHRSQHSGPRSGNSIEFAWRYLQANFHRPINSKTIAAKSGISPEHLIRAFTARYGESPASMLARLRLDRAHTLLLTSDLDIEEVARACGFASGGSFSRAYLRSRGQSARETRSRHACALAARFRGSRPPGVV